MSTEHDWPDGDYMCKTCCICGVRFSGPHNAGKCYLHKDEPTPKSEWGGYVLASTDEIIRQRDETEAFAELGRLILAMPVGATLEHRFVGGDDQITWLLHMPGNLTYWRETPTQALIAAGVGQEEEADELSR